MSAFAADIPRYPLRHGKTQAVRLFGQARVNNGGSVALPPNSFYYDTGMVLVRNGAGTYNLTFPATQGLVYINVSLQHLGAPNIAFMYMTALNPSAGTASFITTATGAPFTPVDNTENPFLVMIELTIDAKKNN